MTYNWHDCRRVGLLRIKTGVSTHPHTDIQQGWYAGINTLLHWALLRHFINSFITWSYQDNFVYSCVRQSNFVYTSSLLISLFIPVSHRFSCLYQSLFIENTSAPVEVSVWLGGITQKSVCVAFCVQDAVQVE